MPPLPGLVESSFLRSQSHGLRRGPDDLARFAGFRVEDMGGRAFFQPVQRAASLSPRRKPWERWGILMNP
jgi:hypothetical protein